MTWTCAGVGGTFRSPSKQRAHLSKLPWLQKPWLFSGLFNFLPAETILRYCSANFPSSALITGTVVLGTVDLSGLFRRISKLGFIRFLFVVCKITRKAERILMKCWQWEKGTLSMLWFLIWIRQGFEGFFIIAVVFSIWSKPQGQGALIVKQPNSCLTGLCMVILPFATTSG